MKAIINKELLKKDIYAFLKSTLIDHYNKVKDNPNPKKRDVKYLGYHAIAYFQYLNVLNTNSAIRLYKKYILSDGKENKFKYKLFYFDSKEIKAKSQIIEIPLYFDELLENVSKYLMNYKLIIEDITKWGYIDYFIRVYKIYTQHFIHRRLLEILQNIGLYGFVALKKHWVLINKELLPIIIEETQTIKPKYNILQ